MRIKHTKNRYIFGVPSWDFYSSKSFDDFHLLGKFNAHLMRWMDEDFVRKRRWHLSKMNKFSVNYTVWQKFCWRKTARNQDRNEELYMWNKWKCATYALSLSRQHAYFVGTMFREHCWLIKVHGMILDHGIHSHFSMFYAIHKSLPLISCKCLGTRIKLHNFF